ncbi:hypothetical protein H8S90_10680 [Olivibacter sp. SDN3]|uniref:hypothetical protein n=1 Tax=Olivibacter sp. SDN3 TaxID=2764720 RepID=UPI001651AF1B|nr:hypothetical protein [Olivibacter sp. SDN3]QNL51993.1 hypothetical protein H8S90_10680 [Olivibacter sp. SDN3]
MRYLYPSLFLLLSVLFYACETKPEASSRLILETEQATIDTPALIAEVQGILSLTSDASLPNRRFTISSSRDEQHMVLNIRPKLSTSHEQAFASMLDTLLKHPSKLSSNDSRLYFNESSPEVIDLLQLDTTKSYTFKIDHASAQWAYEEVENFMTGPLAGSSMVAYLEYRLKAPIPSAAYKLGLENQDDIDPENKAATLVSSIFDNMGSFSPSFVIRGSDEHLEQEWDSLRSNYRVLIAQTDLRIHWAHIDIPYRKFIKSTDQDTIIHTSLEKLHQADPRVYHLLLAPQLSQVLVSHQFEE